ncbi:MAG: internalin, partial [Acidobacteriota bacterium]|nr:internalin [Acidobacteriota bacterium]
GYVVGVNFSSLNNLKYIPEILLKFNHLKKLLFSKVDIHDFSMLGKLPKLVSLTIWESPIDDISFLEGLSNLTTVNLIDVHLTDISALKGLRNLNALELNLCQLTNISALKGLSNLTILILPANRLTDISDLRGLKNLTTLYLGYNRLTDISPLQELSNLKKLELRNNQLTDILALQGLKNLTFLDLMNNKIKKLPEAIVDLDMEIDMDRGEFSIIDKGIFLKDNPLEKPPLEIIRKGKQAIKAYFDSLTEDTLPLNEVKVLLVGDGAAGKTSLVKRLLGLGFNETETQTNGINIQTWPVNQDNKTIKAHLWDFGGQEIMHAAHQFFLSERSLYLLVLDGRKDEKTEYWLKHIESFGGNSPVLVVINKTDAHPGFELNRKFLLEKYPNIKDFYRLSCKENEGFDVLVPALQKALFQVDMIHTPWAVSWFAVKTELENMQEPFLTYRQYREICTRHNVMEKSHQDTLVDFLNDLGVILHFKDLELQDTHVLTPKWVTEAVYKIINSRSLAEHGGVLKLDQLEEILKPAKDGDYTYPPDRYSYIIQLMIKFELCYQLEGNRILIPNLLAAGECNFDFDYDTSLKFIIDYDFLPPSVMPRFIVRRHRDIKNRLQWRTGVVLEDQAYHAEAVIKCDERERRIFIYVNGEQKRDYFSAIRKTLRDINHSFEKLKTTELVPLPDNPEITVKYDDLIGHELGGLTEKYIGELRKGYSVAALLDGIAGPEDRKKEYEKIPRGGGDLYINVNQKVSQKNQQKQIITQTQSVKQETNIQVAIDIKVDLPALKGDFFKLKEELEEMAANNPALAKEMAELAKVEDGLDGLTMKAKEKELAKPLNKLGRLLEKMGDKDSKLSKILEGTKKGVELAQKVGRTYNK